MFKSTIVLVSFLAFLLSCNNKEEVQIVNKKVKGTITLSGAFAMYPMAQKWKEEYNRSFPLVRIDISAGGAGKGIADALSGIVDLGMVSREISQTEIDKGAWFIPVVKDAVVGVINSKNPVLNKILQKGLTKEILTKIFITGEIKTWGEAIGNPSESNTPIQVYTRSDACGAADIWSKYLGQKQEDIKGVGIFGDPGIAQVIQNDVNGIGYNNIGFAYNPKTKEMNENLVAVPLDLNGNGMLDQSEKFYDTQNSIILAIADNIYPSPPARDLYFVSKGKPVNPATIHFLNWILTDGQKYIKSTGYIELTKENISISLTKIK